MSVTKYDWAVWSKFDDEWMAVDHGDPSYCREGAARRNLAGEVHGLPADSFVAGPVQGDGKIVWPWEERTYVELSGAKRERQRGKPPSYAQTVRAWGIANGYPIKQRGLLPDVVIADYEAALVAGKV